VLSVGAIDSGDYVVGVRQLFAAVEFSTNELPVLPVASVALDFVALQRSRRVQGLVVFMPAAAKLTGEGGFFFDVHFVLHGVYFTTVSGFVYPYFSMGRAYHAAQSNAKVKRKSDSLQNRSHTLVGLEPLALVRVTSPP